MRKQRYAGLYIASIPLLCLLAGSSDILPKGEGVAGGALALLILLGILVCLVINIFVIAWMVHKAGSSRMAGVGIGVLSSLIAWWLFYLGWEGIF